MNISKYVFDISKKPRTFIKAIDGCDVYETQIVDADDLEFGKFQNVSADAEITEYLINQSVAYYLAHDAELIPTREVGVYLISDVYGNQRSLMIMRTTCISTPAII